MNAETNYSSFPVELGRGAGWFLKLMRSEPAVQTHPSLHTEVTPSEEQDGGAGVWWPPGHKS